MPTTPNMTIITPSVSVTVGPDWATILNAAFSTVDIHDHSDGKGVKITPLGLNINSDLSIGSQNLTTVNSLRLVSLGAALAGVNDLRAIYSVNGDLYYNNGGGAQIQITSGGSVTAATDGTARRFQTQAIAANTTINPASTYSFVEVDTTTSVTLTLPAANAVSAGRFYEIKDVTGLAGTNNIIVQRAGADTIDGGTSFTLNVNYQSIRVVSDGTSKWSSDATPKIADSAIKTAMIGDSQVTTSKIADSQVTTAKVLDSNITRPKLVAVGQQISSSSGAFSHTGSSTVDVTNLSVTITTTGRPVMLILIGLGSGTDSYVQTNGPASGGVAQINFVRDATIVTRYFHSINVVSYASGVAMGSPPSSFQTMDVISAGTYTYKVQVRHTGATPTTIFNEVRLLAYEL